MTPQKLTGSGVLNGLAQSNASTALHSKQALSSKRKEKKELHLDLVRPSVGTANDLVKEVETPTLDKRGAGILTQELAESKLMPQLRFNSSSHMDSCSVLPLVDSKRSTSYLDMIKKSYGIKIKQTPEQKEEPKARTQVVHPDLAILDKNSKQHLSPLSQKDSKSRPMKGWLGDETTEDKTGSFIERWEIAKFQELTGNRSDRLTNELKKLETSSRSLLDKDPSDYSQNSQNQSRKGTFSGLIADHPQTRSGNITVSKSRDCIQKKKSVLGDTFDLLKKDHDISQKSMDSVINLGILVEELKEISLTPKKSVRDQKHILRNKFRLMKAKLIKQGLVHLTRWLAWKSRSNKRAVMKSILTCVKIDN